MRITKKILKIIQEDEELPIEWEQLQPILVNRQNESSIRLYFNAYGAEDFILAKLMTQRVKEIDHHRESCATTVFEVLGRSPEED